MSKILAALLLGSLLLAAPLRTDAGEDTKRRVSFHFVDEDVRNVIRAIAEYAEVNLVLHPDVQGTVTLHVVDVPWDAALRSAVVSVGATLVEEDAGIYRVGPTARPGPVAAEALLQIHDVADLLESAPDLVEQMRGLPRELDLKMQGTSALVVRATARDQARVAAFLQRLRREQVLLLEIAKLRAEMQTLRDEVRGLRDEVQALRAVQPASVDQAGETGAGGR